MEIEVFTHDGAESFHSSALIDEFSSLIVNKRYFAASSFQLNVSISNPDIVHLKPKNCVLIGSIFYVIDDVSIDEKTSDYVAKGVSLFGLLRHRVIWSNFSLYQKPSYICEQIIRENVTEPINTNRTISLFSMTVSNLTLANVQFQNSYGYVRDEIETLCQTYDFGFKESAVTAAGPSCLITFFKGQDKSNWVEFSVSNEMIISETYEANDYDEATTALIAGEGEGALRTILTLNDGNTSLERKELYVDARDLQSDGLTTEQYNNSLYTRGASKLSEKQAVQLLDGDVNIESELYKYGVDYDVGDTVSVYSARFEVSTTKILTEMQETWDNTGHFLNPTFGKRSPTIADYIKRK